MSELLQGKLSESQGFLEMICQSLRSEVDKLGLSGELFKPDLASAEFCLNRDPANGSDSLVCVWRDGFGHKQGEIVLHEDGSFFAEYDVIKDHPNKKDWFVEAVTAWGKKGRIKSELRLLQKA